MIEHIEKEEELTEQKIALKERENELKIRQMNLNFWKTIIVSVVIAAIVPVTTAVLNTQISNRELDLSMVQGENSFLGQFVERAISEDKQERLRFAQYFATVTPWSEGRERWGAYAELIGREIALDDALVHAAQSDAKKATGEEKQAFKEKISTIQKELGPRPISYWVVAASSRSKGKAQEKVAEINAEAATKGMDLRAFVGLLNPATGIYPVIVGYGSYLEAESIRKQAVELKSVDDDAFLSPTG